jgi:hypothetical protein
MTIRSPSAWASATSARKSSRLPNRGSLGPLLHVAHHVRLDVGGDDPPARPDRLRQPSQEVADPGADIDRGHSRLELEQRHHLARLLPRRPLRVIEQRGPPVRVLEPVFAVPTAMPAALVRPPLAAGLAGRFGLDRGGG